MFDLDISKMIIVGIVALAVIPPKDLPRVMRTVGQTLGRMRRMATELQGQFMEAMREVERDPQVRPIELPDREERRCDVLHQAERSRLIRLVFEADKATRIVLRDFADADVLHQAAIPSVPRSGICSGVIVESRLRRHGRSRWRL